MNDEINEKMTDRADRAVSRQVPAAKPVLDSLYVQALVLPVGGGPSYSFPQFHIISAQPLEQLRMEVPLAVGSPELLCTWCLAPALRQ